VIVEILQPVRTTRENYLPFYLILIGNYIELVPGCSVPVERNTILDSVASDQELSERQVHQEAALDGEAVDEDTNLEMYITGKVISQSRCCILITLTPDLRLEFATEWSNFPLLSSVKLVIFGSNNEGKALLLERVSPEAWKQSSMAKL